MKSAQFLQQSYFNVNFVFAGYDEIAEILIGNGADVNIKNYFQQTPLFAAAYNGISLMKCNVLLNHSAEKRFR